MNLISRLCVDYSVLKNTKGRQLVMKQLLLVLALSLFMIGCAEERVVTHGQASPAVAAEETTIVKVPDDPKPEPSVRFADWTSVPQLEIANFDLDKYSLRADAREVLKKNSQFLKSQSDVDILVEGHCDERGTVEYNLALAQKRAESVRKFYGYLGISLKRIATISYGNEKPLDPAHNETAWEINRRAVTKIRSTKNGK